MQAKETYQALTISKEVKKIIIECFRAEREGNKNARVHAKRSLKKYLIKTADGSYTLKSNNVDGKSENMHTHHGAIKEAMKKFVNPAQLQEKDEVHILDICSGLGYNAASCIKFLADSTKINVDIIEISMETLAAALLIPSPIKSHEIIKKAIENRLYDEGFVGFKYQGSKIPENVNINVIFGDARDEINKLNRKHYDAVFLDPFSPGKSPELYSLEFFYILYEKLKDNGTVLTYTSAAPVRSAMIQAGFQLGEGPAFGRTGGTTASPSLENIQKPLSMDDERMIALSDAGVPFRDPKLNDSSIKIAKRREDERKMVRGIKKFPSTVRTPIYLYKEVDNIRLKRRILKNLKNIGIEDLKSGKSKFIICPQFEECICGCGIEKLNNSADRIGEMARRLSIIVNGDKSFTFIR